MFSVLCESLLSVCLASYSIHWEHLSLAIRDDYSVPPLTFATAGPSHLFGLHWHHLVALDTFAFTVSWTTELRYKTQLRQTGISERLLRLLKLQSVGGNQYFPISRKTRQHCRDQRKHLWRPFCLRCLTKQYMSTQMLEQHLLMCLSICETLMNFFL